MSPKRLAAAALVLLLLATHVDAQPSGRDGRRGGFGRRGMLNDQMRLLSMPEVREELAIDEEQGQFLDALVADLRDQQRAAYGGLDDSADPEERESRFDDFRDRLGRLSRQSEQLLSAVLEPRQAARLEELRLQYEGIRAFDRPPVVAALELSESQQDQIREIREAASEGPGRRGSSSEVEAQVNSLLSGEQLAKWEEMKGAEFKFPERRGRFGRRGFPGRR